MRNNLPAQPSPQALPGDVEPEYTYAPESQGHLLDYWKIVVKRRRLVIATAAAVLIVGAYFSFTATTLYTANATLKIEPHNPSVTGVGMMVPLGEGGGGQYDYHQTQFRLLESRGLAARVATELKLDSNKTFTQADVTSANPISRIQDWFFGHLYFVVSLVRPRQSEEPPPDMSDTQATSTGETATAKAKTSPPRPQVRGSLVGKYMSFLEVRPVRNTRLVEVRFTTPSRYLSQQLTEAHARGFIRMTLENRFELTKEARDFLDTKNAELKQKLQRSEDALNRFRQTHGVVSMDKGENIVVERLVDLNRQLTVARTQRIEAESLYKVVENKSTHSLAQVMTQGMVPNLRSNLLNLEGEKVKLSTIFKPDHPRMIELNKQITETKRAINTELNNVVRGIRDAFIAARSKEEALQAEAQKQQQTALNLKEVGVHYAVLEEEVRVNRSLYESVLKRLNETNISNDIAVSNMQITQHAELPRSPSGPNIPMHLVMYGLLGLVSGVGLVFVLEYLDSSVSTPQHVWRAVGLNTFGVVPDLNSLDRKLFGPNNLKPPLRERGLGAPTPPSRALISAHHPLSIISDSYRTIRTALLFSQAEKPPQIVLMTSPSPGEGKTVSTLNLAIALAQEGRRVLVIDADLRKGCCHARLGIRNHSGLSNILTGHLSLEDGIQPTPIRGLSLLSRGICPPNPSDLLGSNKMREVLKRVRESFDFILVDSPPAIAVSDAAIVSIMCDGVIFVFHGKKTTTASARQALERLDAIRAPVIGVILNSINLDDPDYAYYRSYYGSDYGTAANDLQSPNGAEKTLDIEARPKQVGRGIVPKTFLDDMVLKLGEAVGPMAPLIVRDQIAFLGESRESFPKDRLNELLERVGKEILDDKLRFLFQRSMQDNVQAL
ncbi:MAG: GumC family protein [Candidatus Binatia bacterium]